MPDYVVGTAGDTVKGEINYRDWDLNPEEIYFKKQGAVAAEILTPLNIKAFYTAGQYYYSGIVQAEKSSQNILNLTQDHSFTFATDTTFLQAIVVGEKSLFRYVDKDNLINFYISTESGFELLKFKLYLISHEGLLVKRRNKTYLNQLTNYFGDCEEALKNLSKVEYTHKSLIKAFKAYYICKEQSPAYVHEIPREQAQLGAVRVLAGPGFTNLGLGQKTIPMVGVSFDFAYPYRFKRWSVNSEALFSHFAAAGSYKQIINSRENLLEYDMELYSFKLSNMIRYTHPGNSVRFFVNSGLVQKYSWVSKHYHKKTSSFGPTSYEEVWEYPLDVDISFGYLLGGGLLYNRLSIEARVDRTLSLLGAFGGSTTSVLLGYRINN